MRGLPSPIESDTISATAFGIRSKSFCLNHRFALDAAQGDGLGAEIVDRADVAHGSAARPHQDRVYGCRAANKIDAGQEADCR